MENISMIPMSDVNVWQISLTALDCAASALATLEVQGVDVRRAVPASAAFAPFAAGDAAQAIDPTAVKRERALTGKGHRGNTSAYVLGSPAWSHPN
ncbi:MAG TPA: hypothetical protein VNS46_00445 [Nocardioides sp.]|nr:hypothetical protein [Nocardioides sp.]